MVNGEMDMADGVVDLVGQGMDAVDVLKGVEDEIMEVVNGYVCGECGLGFTALKDFDIHQDKGNHKGKLTDHVKMFWISKCVNIKRNVTKSSFTGSWENAQKQFSERLGFEKEKDQ